MRSAVLGPLALGLSLAATALLSSCGVSAPKSSAPAPTQLGDVPSQPPATPHLVAPAPPPAVQRVTLAVPEATPHVAHAAAPKTPIYLAPPGAPPPVPVYWFGSPAGGHVYITIDDGWTPSAQVLTLMQKTHLPLTAFLIRNAMAEHLAYWKAFVAAGGVVEDHTVSHPDLVLQPYSEVVNQWSGERQAQISWLGTTPTVGRPPYGGLNQTVEQAANAAGLKGIVMWSASMGPRGLVTWNGRPIQAGDIILMHWDPGLYNELVALLKILAEHHLTPAPLFSGLPVAAQ